MTVFVVCALLLCLLVVCKMAGDPDVVIENDVVHDGPARGQPEARKARVSLPRVWMKATDALVVAYHQTGLQYAIIPADFDGAVGPFPLGEPVEIEDLVRRVAEATATHVQWINDVAVFDPVAADEAGSSEVKEPECPRAEVAALDALGDASTVVRLTQLAGHEDGSVRIHALAALQRLEGDFMRGTYPGRVSIFEVLAEKIDHQALLYALEEGGPLGSRSWKLAAEILGRARERVLSRYLWWHLWLKPDGVMEVALWAAGRCGDPSAAWSMRGRVQETFTNDPSHRYLAAMSLGQLDATARLVSDLEGPDVDLRRAVAFGLGFCSPTNEEALAGLTGLLDDADPSVRFVACQSLARMGSREAVGKLTVLASHAQASADVRASAIEALVALGRPEAAEAVLARCADPDPAVRARAASLLADVGGPRAHEELISLVGAEDRWVRCAAVCALARLGTGEGIRRATAVLANTESDGDERISALLGLGRSLSPEAAEPLRNVAHDTTADDRLRRYAVLGLARLAGRAGQQHMVELADRASEKYLSFAVRHLALETAQATAEFLIPYLTHAGREGACAAAGRLAEIGCGPAVVELLEGSDVFDNHTRMMHMWGTVRARGRSVTMALAEAGRSRRGSIRRTAAFALGGRLYPEAVDALIRLARDRDDKVRAAAAQSLGVTPDPIAVDLLIDLAANDGDLPVAIEAVRALRGRDFRDLPQVRDALNELAGSPRDAGGIAPERPSIADQPAHSFVLRTWPDHPEEDLVSNLTYESSLCYDAHNQRIVMWGAHGRRYDTPQTAQTWFLDTGEGQWTRLTGSRQWPNGVCGVRGTMYDRSNRVVVSPRSGGSNAHGWHNALRANLMHSSPWVLDVTTDQWYAAKPATTWSGGYMPASHDPVHGVNVWWRDGLVGYDVYANRWIRFEPEGPVPECPRDTGGEFDPQTGRFIAVADASTWAFDPAKNHWTDLEPEGDHPPARPMVYDTANDVMLSFQVVGDEVGVWVYHIRENRWERLPAIHPCPARGKIWDAVYDEKNNLTVITGTDPEVGITASLNCRETWTYRYRPAERACSGPCPPRDVRCVTAEDGSVTIRWTPDGDERVKKYRIERGVGDEPWLVQWERAGEVDGGQHTFADRPDRTALTFYRVVSMAADGSDSRPSLPARTAPRMIHHVTAMVRPEGGVQLRWAAPDEPDVVGCHVYRVPVDLGSPWTDRFNPDEVFGSLVRITDAPVTGSEFVDDEATVTGPADALRWPKTFAYVVRPVNAWGIQGGPSPVTLALPDPPGPLRVIPWADGRRLVLWSTCLSGSVTGYHLMRMDDWHRQHVFRLQAAPLPAPAFFDTEDFPATDRRRYYASGVDTLGTVGIPTSGAWSHGYP